MKKNKITSWAVSLLAVSPAALAQQAQLGEIVVSASRGEQSRFDAPAAIDSVTVDPATLARPLVNLSELVSTVPGLLARDRQNYAQDLQLSVRGFGTRATFGVRGVRILVDGIPATMPDGQGQAATASLSSASRIEVLRGPLAQLYGNAAGGVVQVFSRDPVGPPNVLGSVGLGSYDQRQTSVVLSGGSKELSGLVDLSHFQTGGYRDHSAAERKQANAKLVARPSEATTITGIVNVFNTPLAQDPLGLSRSAFQANPRQAFAGAFTFDTRKSIAQQQLGLTVEHKLSPADTLQARAYYGTRQVFQTLALQANGVVDLDRGYGGLGLAWQRKARLLGEPLNWIVGAELDRQRERRKGFDNNFGTPGALRRDENGLAANSDLYAQASWLLHPQWTLTAGARASRVRLAVDDYFLSNGNDSGSVRYHQNSPVLGATWHASESLNVYANIGQGFETPTLAEAAYSSTAPASGPNFGLRASSSRQAELGFKYRRGVHTLDAAVFAARSSNEIVPLVTANGRSVFQNVDDVQRRGVEAAWQARFGQLAGRVAYTLVDARFQQAFNSANGAVASGNRLPGVPLHALAGELSLRHHQRMESALEMRIESKTWVNDLNSEAAPGFAVFNLRSSVEWKAGAARMMLFGRIDNLLDKKYAGSVIVNDGNGRFYEPAPGRALFVGLRAQL